MLISHNMYWITMFAINDPHAWFQLMLELDENMLDNVNIEVSTSHTDMTMHQKGKFVMQVLGL